ncbi:glycosyltransferase 87 family protein [Gordonia sp. CPCC 205515]|uniref:glycosyltransferase 87 family protein n=1 Tax=Gordonia sp. CPCC 205515 TaxID=3140791 RepID=UPI003AF34E9F
MATGTEVGATPDEHRLRRPTPRRTTGTGAPTTQSAPRYWRSWGEPILVFLAIRAVGILLLARFAQLRETALGDALWLWDGKWMVAIAQYGYADVPYSQTDARGLHTVDTAYAFFPGYPYLVGAVAKLPLITPFGAALAVNLILGCIAAVGAARLGRVCARMMAESSPIGRANPRRTGLFLVALFAATPMSIVLNMAYTEALFCALAVWALVGVLEHRWLLAGLCTMLAGASRPTAVVLIGVVMLAALLARRDGWRAWAAVVLSPLGYLGYLAVVWAHTGSPTGWFRIQTEGWGTEFDWGRSTYTFVNETLVHSGEVAPVATAWIILSTLVMLGVAAWSRLPWPVLLYGALVVASIVLSSGLMMSRARLLLPAFVLLVPVAMVLARWRPQVAVAAMVPVVLGSAWFGAHMLTVYPHAM